MLGGVTIDRRRRRKHNILDVVLVHSPEEVDGAADIDTVIFRRDLCGLDDGLKKTRHKHMPTKS